jgi:hypothetical protein
MPFFSKKKEKYKKCRITLSQLRRFMLLSDINNESITHPGEFKNE